MRPSSNQGNKKEQQNRRPVKRGRAAKRIRLWPLAILLVLLVVIIAGQFAAGENAGWRNLLGLNPGSATEPQETKATTENPQVTSIPETSLAATATPSPSPSPTPIPEIRVTLIAAGDILMHKPVIDGGLVAGTKDQYDFIPIFQYVRPIFQEASLTLANYEGTLAGPPYSGYPFFSAPDAIADALADTGIKVLWTANNHTIDKGLDGVIRTAQVFRDKGFQVVGTRPDEASPADAVVDVNGIKLGLMAYTFETIGTPTQKTLNGNKMPAAADPLINSFNPYRDDSLAKDMQAMLERVEVLRGQGAELICISLHWGNEYNTRSSAYQRKMAQQLADAGVELIFGHHPHVLQEIDVLTSQTTGKPTLVYYSMGNFISNQNFDTGNSAGNAQDGLIARVSLLKNAEGVRIELGEYIPTHVVRVAKGSGTQHLVVPVLPGLESPAAYQTTPNEMSASLARITAILGESPGTVEIPVRQAAE